MRKFIQKIIKNSFNLSPYVKNYIFESNVRSGIFVGIVVSILEIWMLISAIYTLAFTYTGSAFSWWLHHLISYCVLLATAITMLMFSIRYLKGDDISKKLGLGIQVFFAIVSLIFGIYISYVSRDSSGQVFAFLTMVMFVICLFVWHPLVALVILSVAFSVYLYVQSRRGPLSYSMWVNSFTCWIVLLITSMNNHHQRRIEAHKDEMLEKMNNYLRNKSNVDELTGIPSMAYFRKKATEILQDESVDITKLRFVFMNIENFSSYNEKYGFGAGNNFLRKVGQFIQEVFPEEAIARFSDDHFVTLCSSICLREKLSMIKDKICNEEESLQMGLKAGIYAPEERLTSPSNACDHARYACNTLKKMFNNDIAEYDTVMEQEFNRKRYIINTIDEAVEKGYLKVFYQPVVWAENGKLCGAEALARWDDPEYGLLAPTAFVPILEEYHQIHKLDLYVMEQVCKDLYEAYEERRPIVPISINISRLDFELIDPVERLDRLIQKYNIDKGDLHVEITESALSASDNKLQNAMDAFRTKGYALWLDDFGSGYSGLNVLKDFNFDMMKIDMMFLKKFSENEKTQPILSSIVALANKIGMQTLTEGVETEEAYEFLKKIGCQRLQGYLFGKPMPKQEFIEKLMDGTYDTSSLRRK